MAKQLSEREIEKRLADEQAKREREKNKPKKTMDTRVVRLPIGEIQRWENTWGVQFGR